MDWAVPGYRHLRQLGRGSTGRVVLARHEVTGDRVAIKYLSARLLADEEFLTRFRREAGLLAELDDPGLVRCLRYVESAEGAAIVMEAVEGVSLATLLASDGPTTPEAALLVLKGALHGLAAAHEAGIVHRDLKPGNVLIREDGAGKLADFGIAVKAGEQVPAAGTPAYMAPEQWTSGRPVTPAADVYAATAVFYECLTGEHPYRASTPIQLAVAHGRAPIPVGKVPVQVQPLVAEGLAKDPADRPASATVFLRKLEVLARRRYGAAWEIRGRKHLAERASSLALLSDQPSAAPTAPPEASASTGVRAPAGANARRRARRGSLITAAATVIVLCGGAAMCIPGNRTPDRPSAAQRQRPAHPPRSAAAPTSGAPVLPRHFAGSDTSSAPVPGGSTSPKSPDPSGPGPVPTTSSSPHSPNPPADPSRPPAPAPPPGPAQVASIEINSVWASPGVLPTASAAVTVNVVGIGPVSVTIGFSPGEDSMTTTLNGTGAHVVQAARAYLSCPRRVIVTATGSPGNAFDSAELDHAC